MSKLNQIIAVEKGLKSKAFSTLTDVHHQLQGQNQLAGLSRTYQPVDEDGEVYPPESTRVQAKADDLIGQVVVQLTELFDATATKDWANCEARADVEIDGDVLLEGVPVTYLLFLEKQLVDIHTLVTKLPILDAAEAWDFDEAADCFSTEPVQTTKTKKVPRNHVKADATKEHPAQVEVYYEDVVVGHWRTVKFSGAVSAQRANELIERVEKLQRALKFAREEANTREVEQRHTGQTVFDYVFGA